MGFALILPTVPRGRCADLLNSLWYCIMQFTGDRLLASVVRAPTFLPADDAGEAPDDQPPSIATCSGALGEP